MGTTVAAGGAPAKGKTKPPPTEFTQLAADRFADIDTDKDGFISTKDLDRALQDPKCAGNAGCMVATLRRRLGDFEEMSDDEFLDEDDGLTPADIAAYDRIRADDPTNEGVVRLENNYQFLKQKLANQNRSLVAGSGQLDHTTLQQGSIGDCWFVAALVAAVARDEASVRRMIAPDPDNANNFRVTFPGAVVKPVTVTPLTDGEVVTFASAGANGLWMGLLEKAAGIALNFDSLAFHSSSSVDELDGGRFTTAGIKLVTGHGNDTDIISLTRASTIRKKLSEAFAKKAIVVAGIRNTPFGDTTSDGLPVAHVYSVLAFDAKTDKLTIRNPWGSNSTPFSGTFELTMDKFTSNFSDMAYEEVPKCRGSDWFAQHLRSWL